MINRAKFLVFKGNDNLWYWHLQANNNEIIAQSEGYESKQGALKGIDAVRDACQIAKVLIEIEE